MALINMLDPEAVQERLGRWLPGQLQDAEDVRVRDVEVPQAAGLSMTTILFKASWKERGETVDLDLVARVAPSTPAVFDDTDLGREFELLEALADTPVRVPTARWFESGAEVLGGPFLVVDRAYGEVPSDDPPYTTGGWVLELEPARRGLLYERAIEVIAQVHAVDWKARGLERILAKPEFGETGVGQQIARWEAYYDWARDGKISSPTIEAALVWVKQNMPADEELVLNWGDARIGNIIFDAGDLSVQAVLDWELATIASPEMELGWLLTFPRLYSEAIGIATPAGLQSRAQLIDRWERVTGRPTANVDYYEAFAALKLSMMMVRAGVLMIGAGKLPADSRMPVNNPAANILAGLLGLPAPAGESDFFVGKRG
jgi:aminoglycoside phosphotransferase (APT) family kinase protein